MKCNLKERALALFRKNKYKKEQKIIKDFNKRFGCKLDLEDVELKWDIVIFHFDGFDIWGNSCKGKSYFNFQTETFVRYGLIETIEDLGYLVEKYIMKQSKCTVDASESLMDDEDYIALMR